MADSMHVGVDRFAMSLEELIGDSFDRIDGELPGAIRKSCAKGRREVRKLAASSFRHGKERRYEGGWTYRLVSKGGRHMGEIGNRDVPGLPHLLEKGHAKVGGGRVPGREHVSVASEAAFEELERRVREAVDRAL